MEVDEIVALVSNRPAGFDSQAAHQEKFMEFKQILPHIYQVEFEECYDLAMHFLRYQEYYESLKFHGQIFTLVDYMEWYSKTYGKGSFTYTDDWSGFNVPSQVLIEVSEAEISDLNKYDIQMRSLVETIRKEEGEHKFYFIGTYKKEEDEEAAEDLPRVLDHEIGHALYFIDDDYRTSMDKLLDEMPRKNYNNAWKTLQKMRYHPSVCRDEIHAYSCTGPDKGIEKSLTPDICAPFIKEYKKQRRRFKLDG